MKPFTFDSTIAFNDTTVPITVYCMVSEIGANEGGGLEVDDISAEYITGRDVKLSEHEKTELQGEAATAYGVRNNGWLGNEEGL